MPDRARTLASHRRSRFSLRVDRTRSGAAAIELAVCLPVILLLVFGSIEASSHIFLKQSLSLACYEAGQAAAGPSSQESVAIVRAEKILSSRGVKGYEIRFHSGVETLERGEKLICEVSAPTLPNSPLARRFISNRTLTARTVMIKE